MATARAPLNLAAAVSLGLFNLGNAIGAWLGDTVLSGLADKTGHAKESHPSSKA
jgi:DHA1 family inner membrane transport protein